jgi:hypothetical protein
MGGTVIVNGQRTVDHHVTDALGLLLRVLEGRGVAHRGGIEQNQVGGVAFGDGAATMQP